MESICVIIGRTCSGKTSLAKLATTRLGIPVIHVGDLIRRRTQDEPALRERYLGSHGFSDEFISTLVESEYRRLKPQQAMVIEGSLGLGDAVTNIVHIRNDLTVVTLVLDCDRSIRMERCLVRQKQGSRAEARNFFEGREHLFDEKLAYDTKKLSKLGKIHNIDCSDSLEENYRQVARYLEA